VPEAMKPTTRNSDTGLPTIVRLNGRLQRYAWGTSHELPTFLGLVDTGEPAAEWWLGAHPSLPSLIAAADGASDEVPLDAVIAADPDAWLGSSAPRFDGQLPYLLKILSVGAPLSLQVHPSVAQARDGFARESATGLDALARERNYRDANHKPELIVALTSFTALCGFAPVNESLRILHRLFGADASLSSTLNELVSHPSREGLRHFVGSVLSATPADAHRWTDRIAASAGTSCPAHLIDLACRYPADAGVVVAALLNHVVLAPGEALFLAAGQLHAYLYGLGLELMANSDNVLRGGLTPKHVDVPELLRVLDPVPGQPEVLHAQRRGAFEGWQVDVDDFALRRLELWPDATTTLEASEGPRIVLSTAGAADLRDPEDGLRRSCRLDRGQAAFVRPRTNVTLETDDKCALFVAEVPQN
jgi:mannose-6-phosphate isomerase